MPTLGNYYEFVSYIFQLQQVIIESNLREQQLIIIATQLSAQGRLPVAKFYERVPEVWCASYK